MGPNFTHFGEREDREFQEAMREQVGTTFSHIYSSNKMESFSTFTEDGIIIQCTARKKPKFRPYLPLSSQSFPFCITKSVIYHPCPCLFLCKKISILTEVVLN